MTSQKMIFLLLILSSVLLTACAPTLKNMDVDPAVFETKPIPVIPKKPVTNRQTARIIKEQHFLLLDMKSRLDDLKKVFEKARPFPKIP